MSTEPTTRPLPTHGEPCQVLVDENARLRRQRDEARDRVRELCHQLTSAQELIQSTGTSLGLEGRERVASIPRVAADLRGELDRARAELSRLDPAKVAGWIAERDDLAGALAGAERELDRLRADDLADRLAAVLAEVLATFTPDGGGCSRGWVSARTVERWERPLAEYADRRATSATIHAETPPGRGEGYGEGQPGTETHRAAEAADAAPLYTDADVERVTRAIMDTPSVLAREVAHEILAALGEAGRLAPITPSPPPGWAYVAAVHQLTNHLRRIHPRLSEDSSRLRLAVERVEEEQAKLTPSGIQPAPIGEKPYGERVGHEIVVRTLHRDERGQLVSAGNPAAIVVSDRPTLAEAVGELVSAITPAEREG